MTRCQWCDKEAVEVITLEPARVDKKTGKTLSSAVMADVCTEHRAIRDREAGKPIPDMRRRKAKGFNQSSIFDFIEGDDPRAPRDAIRGMDAA